MPKFKDYFSTGSGEVSTVLSIQMGVCFGAGNPSLDELFKIDFI